MLNGLITQQALKVVLDSEGVMSTFKQPVAAFEKAFKKPKFNAKDKL